MPNESNEQNPMDKARDDILETITLADSARQRLVLRIQELELFGNTPESAQELHQAYAAHATVCEQLKNARQLLAATE